MNATQKFAWFNLSVVGLCLLIVLSLFPWLGHRALGGFGVLGLSGFGPLFFRKKPGQVVVSDERDALIQMRSLIVAYSLFWVAFVLAAVFFTPLVFGQSGSVPVEVVQLSVAGGWMILQALTSVATLIQYQRGSHDAA